MMAPTAPPTTVPTAQMSDVTIIDDGNGAIEEPRYIQWGPVIGGAIAAAALGLVMGVFAAGIGLSASSTAPTWRD